MRDIIGNPADHAASGGPDAHDHLRQRILNAGEIPNKPHTRWVAPRPVTARVVWEADGEQLRDTVARYWVRRGGEVLVLVDLVDVRHPFRGVWLRYPGDVTPRTSAQQ